MKKVEIITAAQCIRPAIGNRFSGSYPAIPRWKRPLDGLVILLSLPLWLPAALLCGLWIGLVSKGGVLYSQERIGYSGKQFTIFKFRTMRKGADTAVHAQYLQELIGSGRPMIKLDGHDPRLIRGGKFLRATGLDELPQLLNVLRGEMSLVGPRPCTPSELNEYKPGHWKRFNGLPGITGSWQVNGKNKTTFRRMLALDICYLRHQSIAADLAVMIRTLPVILREVGELRKRRRAARAEQERSAAAGQAATPRPQRQQTTEVFRVAKSMMSSTQRLTDVPSGLASTSIPSQRRLNGSHSAGSLETHAP